MGKRGPKPRGAYAGKTAVFSTRIMPETLMLLNEAKKAHATREWSLSQEIEDRLRRTLSDDETEIDLYGSKQNATIVKLIGLVIRAASARGKHEWLKEQWLFDDVMAAIRYVLLWFRPGGDSGIRDITLSSGTDRADQLINEIRSADPSLPITEGSARQHAMARLKDKLGDLVSGRNPYDDLREAEPPAPSNISNRLKRKQRQRK
jgi:hypothetical protein